MVHSNNSTSLFLPTGPSLLYLTATSALPLYYQASSGLTAPSQTNSTLSQSVLIEQLILDQAWLIAQACVTAIWTASSACVEQNSSNPKCPRCAFQSFDLNIDLLVGIINIIIVLLLSNLPRYSKDSLLCNKNMESLFLSPVRGLAAAL